MSLSSFGLDSQTASARDVKREYARRLKTCRPDQDPEGFRVLHEAYTTALTEVEWRDTADTRTAVVPEENGNPAGGSSGDDLLEEREESPEIPKTQEVNRLCAPKDVMAALERLEAELRSRGGNIEPLVRDAEAVLYQNPDAVIPWGKFLYRLITLHGSHPDVRLKSRALLFEMENNGALASFAVVERLDRTGNLMGIATLADQFRTHAPQIRTPACGAVAARLACAAAFWSPENTASLADIAYQNLDRGDREHHMHDIEQHGHMRVLLLPLPKRFQGFWRQKLMRVTGSPDWTSSEAVEAVAWLKMKQVRRTQAAQVLRQLLPENLATGVPVASPEEIEAEKDPGHNNHRQQTTAETVNSGTTPLWDQPAAVPKNQTSTRRRVSTPPVRTYKQPVQRNWAILRGFSVVGLITILKACFAFYGEPENRSTQQLPLIPASRFHPQSDTRLQFPDFSNSKLGPAKAASSTPGSGSLPTPADPTQNPMLKYMKSSPDGER